MSKATKALETLRDMSPEDLERHLMAQRRKLFEIRLQQATGQVENHSQIRQIRRELARAMTVQMQARGQAAQGPEAQA